LPASVEVWSNAVDFTVCTHTLMDWRRADGDYVSFTVWQGARYARLQRVNSEVGLCYSDHSIIDIASLSSQDEVLFLRLSRDMSH